jgi:hypothetical protein
VTIDNEVLDLMQIMKQNRIRWSEVYASETYVFVLRKDRMEGRGHGRGRSAGCYYSQANTAGIFWGHREEVEPNTAEHLTCCRDLAPDDPMRSVWRNHIHHHIVLPFGYQRRSYVIVNDPASETNREDNDFCAVTNRRLAIVTCPAKPRENRLERPRTWNSARSWML